MLSIFAEIKRGPPPIVTNTTRDFGRALSKLRALPNSAGVGLASRIGITPK